jgi:DNA end-binding protein Ku
MSRWSRRAPSRSTSSSSATRSTRKPYYLRPDGKVGHDAFAVIREMIRDMDMVAIGRLVLTNREHIIALEPMGKGLVGTLLRYPYEVRSEEEYFDEIQNVKVTKDMLDLAKHIVNQKSGRFEPEKFEDQYETALVDLINEKRAGKPIKPKERPAAGNVVDLMEALRRSVGNEATPAKAGLPVPRHSMYSRRPPPMSTRPAKSPCAASATGEAARGVAQGDGEQEDGDGQGRGRMTKLQRTHDRLPWLPMVRVPAAPHDTVAGC